MTRKALAKENTGAVSSMIALLKRDDVQVFLGLYDDKRIHEVVTVKGWLAVVLMGDIEFVLAGQKWEARRKGTGALEDWGAFV